MSIRLGLRPRFALFIVLLFAVLFGFMTVLLVVRTGDSERSTLNEQSKSFATLSAQPIGSAFLLYKDSGSLRIQQQIAKFTDLDSDISGVSIVDTNGQVLFASGTRTQVTAAQASTFDPIYVVRNQTIRQIITPYLEDYGVHRYAIVYSVSDSRLVQDLQRTVAIILLLSIVAFAATIVGSFWLINFSFLSPVSTISRKARNISGGALEDQISLSRNDELGDLAEAVNTMANSLKADINKLQEADKLKSEFVTISSHNLRTPLTVISGELEIVNSLNPPEDLKDHLNSMASSARRLDHFIEDLLAISSMESGKLAELNMQPEPLKPLLDSLAGNYDVLAKQKKLAFEHNFELTDQKVMMNQHLLKMGLANLLENAFKFTEGGRVSLGAKPADGLLVITVTDTGIGIAAAELPKLFTKFHRGTSVMQYDYEGTGIGLYLTKLILTEHHGSISVESTEGKGTTFTIKLPQASPATPSASPPDQPASDSDHSAELHTD